MRDGLATVARAWGAMVGAVREDHEMLHRYDEKYRTDSRADDRTARRNGAAPALVRDLVGRIGFQMLAAYRFMRFCVDAGIPVAPQVASRLIRHAYGSDIHWEARLDPGIVVVHGMGLAVSRAARVERGAILFQNVTLGMAIDPETRETGAPHLEPDVHVGAGSTIVGPITLGTRSKVSANCLLRASIPADSLVEAPTPVISHRLPRRVAASLEVERQ